MPSEQPVVEPKQKTNWLYRHGVGFFIASCVVGLGVATGLLYGPISDYYVIKDANPAMIDLAKQADMSRKGELIFLRTHPVLEAGDQFDNDCSTAGANHNGSSILGCYVPNTNRIYLLKMPADLYDEEVATAAYEMLHPVYLDLAKSNKTALNQAIEQNYNSAASTPDISGQVQLFAKIEPGERDLELFSILGTEDANLTPNLNNYYRPYFTDDLTAVYDANQHIDSIFQGYQNQLNQLSGEINQDEAEATTAYNDSVSWAYAGNAYEDNYNYNIYLRYYNQANDLINQYNQIVGTFNTLVSAISGGQPINQIEGNSQSAAP